MTPDLPTYPRALKPCSDCPWRRDAQPGRFQMARYDALRATSIGPDGNEATMCSSAFACHKSAEGKEIACAGWLATAGHNNLAIRLAVAMKRLPGTALQPGPGWTDLYDDFEQMVAAQRYDGGES